MPETILYFLGERNYVQGATVLRFSLERIQEMLNIDDLSKIFVSSFKQLKEVNSLLSVLPMTAEEPEGSKRATLSVDIDGQMSDYKIVALPEAITARRPEPGYRQTAYQEYDENEAGVQLPYAGTFWDLLTEAVQLTKVFHINKYNRVANFRFLVGGFEQLRCFQPGPDEVYAIRSRIIQHMKLRNNMYNNTRITIAGDKKEHSFRLAFIGIKEA